MSDSFTVMSHPHCSASSLSVEAIPPRVGSRKHRTLGAASSTAAIRWFNGAASLSTSAWKFSPSRQLMMVMPWSPSVPVTSTASPGWQSWPPSFTPGASTPTPLVLMKMPSPCPRFTTLVSPVTTRTPASSAASRTDAHMRRRSSIGKPSSRTIPRLSHLGRAPLVATSFTVPHTARRPMSPPGKKCGVTTNESVENARRLPPSPPLPSPSGDEAPSSRTAASLPSASSGDP